LSFAVRLISSSFPRKLAGIIFKRSGCGEAGMGANVAKNSEAPNAESASMVLIPVSPGELIDKMTILAIKTERVKDERKRAMAAQELALLQAAAAGLITSEIAALTARIKTVNLALWEIEDDLRALERAQDFGPRFVALARSVYRTNDERARLKNAISAAAGSAMVEVKEHPDY